MANKGRKLSELAGLVSARTLGDADPIITDVTHDSRKARSGSLYVALRGTNLDGHRFVGAAAAQGAAGVCVDHETASQVPQIIVDDTRAVLGELAAAVHDYPSSSLEVIGVTGTNGKTTVTHYIESIALQAGLTAGLIGTIHTRIAGIEVPAEMTTPEASDFQSLLAEMRDDGVSVVAAEVSSHALEYGRVRATRFAVAAFTNMSQDHLDFHGDMASYRAAKERLFREYEIGTAVLNIDDPVGAEIASSYQGEAVTIGAGGDLRASSLRFVPGGTGFRFHSPWGTADVVAPVLGDFNVSNLMIAASCCLVIGMDFATVTANMGTVDGVPGRFEIVSGDDPIMVIVDYAHTPEAVTRVVETARELTDRRVLGLIGAGGDRDRDKRPAMGAAVGRADYAIVTSDNPRSEDPASIVSAVVSGLPTVGHHEVEVDRRLAIDRVIDEADDGDVVLILGRGHEPYQQIGGARIPFDDRLVAAESLLRRRKSTGTGPRSGSMSG